MPYKPYPIGNFGGGLSVHPKRDTGTCTEMGRRRVNAPAPTQEGLAPMRNEPSIPKGYCGCGCGRTTELSPRTSKQLGHVKGEPLPFLRGHRAPRPIETLLSMYDEDEAGCWVWTGHIGPQGYGLYSRRKRDSPKRAHRLFYEHHIGPIPEGTDVHHTCENRACCNPEHLEALSRTEHMRAHSPLSEAQVEEILTTDIPAPELAKRWGVHKETVYGIRRKRRWVA